MTKRTKRYGGFRIGDRVYPKNKKDWRLDEGKVIHLQNGYVIAQFFDCGFSNPVIPFMPNQLINLTRIEEEKRRITDPLPPFPQELAEEQNKRCERYLKIINQDEIMKDLPVLDLRGDDFGKIQNDFHSKGLLKEPTPDPLPSPYTRDVYSFTKDFD